MIKKKPKKEFLHTRVAKETKDKLEKMKKKTGWSMGEVLDAVLAQIDA